MPRWEHDDVIKQIESSGYFPVESNQAEKYFSKNVKANELSYIIVLGVPDQSHGTAVLSVYSVSSSQQSGGKMRYFVKRIFYHSLKINIKAEQITTEFYYVKRYLENCFDAKEIKNVSIDAWDGIDESVQKEIKKSINDSLFFSSLGKKYEFFNRGDELLPDCPAKITGKFSIDKYTFAGGATLYMDGFRKDVIKAGSTWRDRGDAVKRIIKLINERIK
jgi:hypothetical protein